MRLPAVFLTRIAFFCPESGLLVDSPQDAAGWLRGAGYKVRTLLLTHGHVDHTWDVAAIQREHGCQVVCHPETVPMLTEPDFFRRFGFSWEVATVAPESLTLADEGKAQVFEGGEFDVFLVPGHCPGSLCFLHKEAQVLFGGDVLFAGGVGRWDLPGGDKELLFDGIRKKLWNLDAAVKVLPGHGPATTIGHERATNPYVGQDASDW